MTDLSQQLVNGVFLGAVYALFAVGYTLIFGVLDILNLAHHAVFTAGAFICLVLVVRLGLPMPRGLPGGDGRLPGCWGCCSTALAVRPLRRRPDTHFSVLISTIGMGIVFESVILGVFGAQLYRFPPGTFPERVFDVRRGQGEPAADRHRGGGPADGAGAHPGPAATRWGQAVRAVAQNARAASLLGIDVERVIAGSFFIASALGGAAGILSALAFNVLDP